MCNMGLIFLASSHGNPKNLVERAHTFEQKMQFSKVSLVTFLSTALLWLDQGANPPAKHFQKFICVL